MARTGGCLCGAIRYSISAPIKELRACHCIDCQRSSGAHGAVVAFVPRQGFSITRGAPKTFALTYKVNECHRDAVGATEQLTVESRTASELVLVIGAERHVFNGGAASTPRS